MYAKRSQLGITINKVKTTQQTASTEAPVTEDKLTPHGQVLRAFTELHAALTVAKHDKHVTGKASFVYGEADKLISCLKTVLHNAI